MLDPEKGDRENPKIDPLGVMGGVIPHWLKNVTQKRSNSRVLDAPPTQATMLDSGLRWGIESLFSDLKTRGFEVTKTQLKTAERIEKILLLLEFATLWAVCV
jgi:hypothetical protein